MDPTSPDAGGSPRVDHRAPAPPQYSQHGPESPLTVDPALCWLLGASTRASGHADDLAAQLSRSGVLDDCTESAIRGANGYGP